MNINNFKDQQIKNKSIDDGARQNKEHSRIIWAQYKKKKKKLPKPTSQEVYFSFSLLMEMIAASLPPDLEGHHALPAF